MFLHDYAGSAHTQKGPCSWIVVAEIWPLSVRGKGMSIAASSNWVSLVLPRRCRDAQNMSADVLPMLDEQLHRGPSHADDDEEDYLRHICVLRGRLSSFLVRSGAVIVNHGLILQSFSFAGALFIAFLVCTDPAASLTRY